MMTLTNDAAVASSTKLQPASKSSTLPTEIIYVILCFLDPLELMQLQTISRQFHAMVNDPKVWRKMYEDARCPRFPGPFPWQSTRFLQRTLVRSMKVEQTWTTQPLKVRMSSRRQIHCDFKLDYGFRFNHRWISHRWLILRKGMEVIAHDIETDSQQALWNNGHISNWTACSIMSEKGHMIYLFLRLGDGDQHDAAKLLEFRADEDSGQLTGPDVFDVPVTCPEGKPFVRCISAPGTPFVLAAVSWYRVDYMVVFDIRNQIFYKFPQFNSEMAQVQPFLTSWSLRDMGVYLTTTHIIVLSQFCHDDAGLEGAHLVQAFTVRDSPIQDNPAAGVLRLSHEAGGNGYWSPGFYLIPDSVVNRVDGQTTFRFMQLRWTEEESKLFCNELSLPRSRTNTILPISVKEQELFKIKSFKAGYQYYRLGEAGMIRGYFAISGPNPLGWNPILHKFSIDATGEQCVAAHYGPSDGFGLDGFHPRVSVIWFDGVRGRICYRKDRDDGEVGKQSPCQVFVAELE